VSDFGSHFGIKATLLDDVPLHLAQYDDGTGFAGKLDRSFFTLAAPDGTAFGPSRRAARFSPSSWDEQAVLSTPDGAALSVTAFATGLSTDAFLLSIRAYNPGPRPVPYAPLFAIESTANSREFQESYLQLPGAGAGPATVISGGIGAPRVVVAKALSGLTVVGLREAAGTNFRALAPSFSIAAVTETFSGEDYTITVRGAASSIAPHASVGHYLVLASSDASAAEADALAAQAFDSVGSDPVAARTRVLQDWTEFYASLPRPHVTSPAAEELWQSAQAGLRMNLYAPRAAMGSAWGSVPAKPFYDFFYAWDTGIQAVGIATWSSWKPRWSNLDQRAGTFAEQALTVIFRAQAPTGELFTMCDENEVPLPAVISDPPVQGWSMQTAYEADSDKPRARQWLETIYAASASYLEWWDTERDDDHDGLAGYVDSLESGWDDTPRYVENENVPVGKVAATPQDSVDLNAWLVQYAEAMAWAAQVLGKGKAEAAAWQDRADARARLIDERMWNGERGAWEDLRPNATGGYDFVDVLTPTIWWPAFVGSSRDPAKIQRVIESHLLNPSEFFGTYPIPSVAYNDPYYDNATDGAYWRGQIWAVPLYAALQTLAIYGYEQQATVLLDRIVAMMAGKGGPYEDYDAKTGTVGWNGGPPLPSVHLLGMSTALVVAILTSRYEQTRLLVPEARGFHGYVADAAWLTDRTPFFTAQTSGAYGPLIGVDAVSGTLQDARRIDVRLSDPQGNLALNPNHSVTVSFPSLHRARPLRRSVWSDPTGQDTKGTGHKLRSRRPRRRRAPLRDPSRRYCRDRQAALTDGANCSGEAGEEMKRMVIDLRGRRRVSEGSVPADDEAPRGCGSRPARPAHR
jgi:hypothetical protein